MYDSLELSDHNASRASPSMSIGLRRSRFWPNSGAKPLARRLILQLFCRLPFLVLWSLIVIFLMYKCSPLGYTNHTGELPTVATNLEDQQAQVIAESQFSSGFNQFITPTSTDLSASINARYQRYESNGQHQSPTFAKSSDSYAIYPNDDINPSVIATKLPTSQEQPISSTRKPSLDYVRQSKVFILLIDEVDTLLGNKRPYMTHQSKYSKHLVVPARIRLVIKILESHRIEYTLDTVSRTGLPDALLADLGSGDTNLSDKFQRQYSVIVIDDFIKYTKLSRWVRDQLDRHCRTNEIGVVAFLTPDEMSEQSAKISPANWSATQKNFGSSQGPSSSSSTIESSADQFPLTFSQIKYRSCKELSDSCLVNYQLNEHSSILRILKRKPNFTIYGPLGPNLNKSPWISMSSNHVTYEPLTWAWLRRKRLVNQRKRRVPASSKTSNTRRRDTGRHDYPSGADLDSAKSIEQNFAKAEFEYTPVYDDSNLYNETSENEASNPDVIYQLNSDSAHDTIALDEHPSTYGDSGNLADMERQILSVYDRGLYDGIKRVIFGVANHLWLDRILLLDAIEHLSSGKVLSPLERYVQIDIDDVFVGERGTRMNESDANNLVSTQEKFAQVIENFQFNLGFSGKYFKHGYDHENRGDKRLIELAHKFTWFCHTWSHSKAHLFNDTSSIENELRLNLEFAQKNQLPIIGHGEPMKLELNSSLRRHRESLPPTYAVAPHHSGVYPIHEQLYEAWRKILNVQVTSTEEYPHLRPADGRRAFVHKAIKVLPRQTCGLYTHTILASQYPGGFSRLKATINGGELFETILHNFVNIYMTHQSNYAHDRLAPYTFASLFDFVRENTNLQLKFAPSLGRRQHPSNEVEKGDEQGDKNPPTSSASALGPSSLADFYFNLHPEEQEPLWTNPCKDKRHLAIWAPQKRALCHLEPKLLIVGPQKTGTTALHSFLTINPLFKPSRMSPIDFEEVQFFNHKHYFQGVDWYFSRFSNDDNETLLASTSDHSKPAKVIHFDKSATYFDAPQAAKRAYHLLPEAHIVIILVNPADRAYSWYQHMKAHDDPTANSFTFEQVIMHPSARSLQNQSSELKSLRQRCLHPGFYAEHLATWLSYYPSRQIIIIDGQWFRYNPASVMNRLQLILRVANQLDYNQLLVFDKQKGFFCQKIEQVNVISNSSSSSSFGSTKPSRNKCLGKSKGRHYPPMSDDARLYLNSFFWSHNRRLARMLGDLGQPLPIWLDQTMKLALNKRRSVMY